MTPQMIMTIIVLGFAVFLFISEWVRVDVVGIMMMILLPLVGVVVALSASNTFLLPTHQVNALVMRAGGYRTMDYVKAVAIMTTLYLTVGLTMLNSFTALNKE